MNICIRVCVRGGGGIQFYLFSSLMLRRIHVSEVTYAYYMQLGECIFLVTAMKDINELQNGP